MNNEVVIFDSTLAGWTPHPATWNSSVIDTYCPATKTVSYQIEWTDVSITFFLRRGNLIAGIPNLSGLGAEDFTVAYRAIDPAWVDPVLGDPLSSHIVSFQNHGTKYVGIGYSASNWGGASHFLRITQVVERYPG